ncbi:hypothetical protein [Lentilactobacillus senioris]|uniref:hypothetical protein n=1 Tax=Lentilactobacillus senioris TaxID=931534 RepID=UPI003D28D85E
MPIKIKDPVVYECYDSAKCEYEFGGRTAMFEAFASQINNLDDSNDLNIEDILDVTAAILRGVDVELKEERYALYFEAYDLKDAVVKGYAKIIEDANGFPYVSYNHSVPIRSVDPIEKFSATKEEWNKALENTPYLDRDIFQKVYD